MRKAELLLGAAFLVVAAVVIGESTRLGFGWEEHGPEAGFVPFWLAMIMVGCGGVIIFQGLPMKERESFFMSRPAMWAMIWVFLTSTLLALMIWMLGMYIATVVFALLFAIWLGRHSWYVALSFAILMALVVFYGMEKGLTIPLPKSPGYAKGWLPF
ncbi:MAG: tripartite tricarboxylate transporter TctB family protein [Dehalococcoidia bacterium]